MVKKSQAERDAARREGGPSGGTWAMVGVAVAVIGLIAWAALADEAPDDRAGNLEHFGVADDPFMGDPMADVVVVAMESPFCTGCRAFHFNVLPELQRAHFDGGNAVLYYVQSRWSTDDQHLDGGIAQECAHAVGGNTAFWAITDRIYQDPVLARYGEPDYRGHLEATAQAAGADAQPFLTCFDQRTTLESVQDDFRVSRENGGFGTPRFWVFGLEGKATEVAAGQLDETIRERVASSAPS